MYTYIVTYTIIEEQFQKYITIDEAIEDYEILEKVILEQLIEDIYYGEGSSYGKSDITITNIEPFIVNYTNKELNNCTGYNKNIIKYHKQYKIVLTYFLQCNIIVYGREVVNIWMLIFMRYLIT